MKKTEAMGWWMDGRMGAFINVSDWMNEKMGRWMSEWKEGWVDR